jgi:L-lactate dehydrogenase complex protein LldG
MSDAGVIERVRQALGRTAPLTTPPVPPAIDESITRLARGDADLAALFMKNAGDLKMLVERVSRDDLVQRITAFLREKNCRKVALASSPLLRDLDLIEAIRIADIEAKWWDEISLDELYDGYDCGITNVTYAVAETGSLVIKTSAGHGRGLSLVPMFHIAIIEPQDFVPDLVDLFTRLPKEDPGNHVMLISGPSKTADIEMNVVTGVHGPNVVKAFVLAGNNDAPATATPQKSKTDLSYFDSIQPDAPATPEA